MGLRDGTSGLGGFLCDELSRELDQPVPGHDEAECGEEHREWGHRALVSARQHRHRGIIERVLDMVDGKWKVLFVMHLTVQRVCRFGELRKKLPHVTQRMLTLQLREMEADGLLTRHVFAEVPPRVEYSLTEPGRDLKSIYMAMHKWGLRHPDAKHARAAGAKVKTTQPEVVAARVEVRSKGRAVR